MCSSDLIASSTGVLTLGTALDRVYTKAYCWLPAGAFTGSAAGMYPIACTTTTSCLAYSNLYTGGPFIWPSSPTLITTGAGAYTTVPATYFTLASIPLPANLVGLNGSVAFNISATNNNNSNNKIIAAGLASGSVATGTNNTGIYQNLVSIVANQGAANAQFAGNMYGAAGYATYTNQTFSVNTAASTTMVIQGYLANGADWTFIQSGNIQLAR